MTPSNPLLEPWNGPFGLAPFAAIRPEHYVPAFEAAMAERLADVESIAASRDAPGFDNTIAALDRAGRLLDRVCGVFFNLASSETSPALQAIEREMAPRLAAHESRVYMNAPLFARIDVLHEARETLGLNDEQRRLLERFHLDFVRSGARLDKTAQQRHAAIVEELAALTTRFAQNVLADESSFRLVLETEDDLAGLPDFVRAAARQAASERGLDGKHVVTLSRSHLVPFLTFSERRDLRERIRRAADQRGEHPGEHDNRDLVRRILDLRLEKARLHGYASYADYALADTMAGSQAAVEDLLMRVWTPAKARAETERADLQALARASGASPQEADIEAWDWRYWAEKLRQQRYALDEAAIKSYLPLASVTAAAFDCATRLFGITFTPRADVAAYHPDVEAYEVKAVDGTTVGLFLHDNFARPTKRSGAWMSVYRSQSKNTGARAGEAVLPIVVNNNNFAKGAAGEPTLLSFDDARTLFHEFGHGLHGLLSSVTYQRLSGTNVLQDFVELPSQLFEHWLEEPEVLRRHARHWKTGEPIPDALVDKLRLARHFNQGYETCRYVGSALVDMAVHARTADEPIDPVAFEAQLLASIGLPRGVGVHHRLVHFGHLFAGSAYAAGYYVYLWAEVLDADGFDAFVEAGSPFDRGVAERLLRYVYAAGNTLEPAAAYRSFRGRDPQADAMLRGRGLLALDEEATA